MKNLMDALFNIKKNPNKYIGKKSIKRLDLFIVGYVLSQRAETGKYLEEMEGFQEFVQQRYKINYSVRYSEIIRLCSISDELAFDEFYILLNEFHEEKNLQGEY